MIGAILRARGKTTLRIVGQLNGDWIAESLDGFDTPAVLSREDLKTYKVEREATPEPAGDERRGWEALAEVHDASLANPTKLLTPEQQLAKLAADAVDDDS